MRILRASQKTTEGTILKIRTNKRFAATNRQKERIRNLYKQDYRFMEANRTRLFK